MGPDLERYVTESLWNVVEDLCHRRDIDFDKCQQQIIEVRSVVPNLSVYSKSMIQLDLRGYLEERHSSFVSTMTESPTPEYDKFCETVFVIPITNNVI